MSTPHQIKIIHVMKSKVGLSEDDYRTMLEGFGVTTSKDLSDALAQELIKKIECVGIASGTWNTRKKRWDELDERPGMATPKQLRHLEGLWVSVSRQPTLREKQKSFNVFLKNRFDIECIKWIPENMVHKIRRALKTMGSYNNVKTD